MIAAGAVFSGTGSGPSLENRRQAGHHWLMLADGYLTRRLLLANGRKDGRTVGTHRMGRDRETTRAKA